MIIEYKYRIRYQKSNNLKFISHLDTIRTIQRALRRAKLPLVLKGKFNKRQKVSFSQPLPFGFSSITELVDIHLTELISPSEIKLKLNNTLPDGLKIIDVNKLDNNSIPLSKIQFTLYEIEIKINNCPKILFMLTSNDKPAKLSINFIRYYFKDFNIIDICRKKFYAKVEDRLVNV